MFAALWAVPGLLTLIEAYRLASLPRLRGVSLMEGPAGYMIAIGSLLMGFSVWEIITGLRQKYVQVPSKANGGSSLSRKICLTILCMISFLVLIPILGFVLASGFFLATTLVLLGCAVKVTIITALCYCGGLYWMVPLLGLSLPRGIWGI
jgi:hypothetical protein